MHNKLLKTARMGFALLILSFGALPALAQDCKGRMDRITDEEKEAISRNHKEMMAKVNKISKAVGGDTAKLAEELGKVVSKEEARVNYENTQRVSKQAIWDFEEGLMELINPLVNKNIPQEDLGTDNIESGLADYWKNITPEQVQTCLDDGANIDVQNNYKRTPLHNAARFNKNPEVIMTLLNAGADITLKDSNGHTAFDWAGQNKALKDTEAYQALNTEKDESITGRIKKWIW